MKANKLLWSMVALLSLGTYNPVRAQQPTGPQLEATAQMGQARVGVPSVVVLKNLPQATAQVRTSLQAQAAGSPTLRPQTGLTEAQWKALKAQAAKWPDPNGRAAAGGALFPSLSPALSPGTRRSDTPGAFVTIVAQDEDLSCSGGSTGTGRLSPSDMALAVGQNHVVQAVNDCIALYDKTTGALLPGYPVSLNDFLGFPPNSCSGEPRMCFQKLGDPRAMYDFVADRFVVIAIFEDFPRARGFLGLAASQTSNPTEGWNVYRIQVGDTGHCPDYPTLGQNFANDPFVGGIYVGFNIFQCDIGGPHPERGLFDDQVFFLPKGPIYAGQDFGFNFAFNFNIGGTLVDTIQPVNVSEWGQKPRTEFMVNSFNINFGGSGGQCSPPGCNGLVIWSIANTLQQPGSPGPVLSGVVIPTPRTYVLPANADQLGPDGDNSIGTGDTRISGTVQYMGGFLYPTLNTGNGGTSAVLGWQVQPFLDDNGGGCTGVFANACPTITGATVVKEFCYDCGEGHNFGAYYGTIQPDPEGNWTMVFNFSKRSTSPGTGYTSNRVTWPTPFHDGGIPLCQSDVVYTGSSPPRAWGDYTATAPDLLNAAGLGAPAGGTPSRNPAFWFAGMFVKDNGQWSTCIGANRFDFATDP
jgi:hypothetical protein